MLFRKECFLVALTVALLIIFGTFGIFTAEASSFQTIVTEIQTYGAVMPIEANDPTVHGTEPILLPGLPY